MEGGRGKEAGKEAGKERGKGGGGKSPPTSGAKKSPGKKPLPQDARLFAGVCGAVRRVCGLMQQTSGKTGTLVCYSSSTAVMAARSMSPVTG